MKNKPEVVIIGAAIVDLPLRPVGREVFDTVSYPIDQIAMTVGGDAINEATIITRLGHSVRLVSCIGNDVAGNFILDHCRANGIDTGFLRVREDMTTSINVGLVGQDGERVFITNRNGSLWKFAFSDIDLSCLEEGAVLSFASIFNNPLLDNQSMVQIFRRAKERGMVICADMVKCRLGETLEDIREALSYVDYFFPNYDEARELTGKDDLDEIADTFLGCGVKAVVIKIGKRGALIRSAQERLLVPAYNRANCIDTTGAGDNFASGFITALLEGKTLRQCGAFANAVASVSVESVGATTGLLSRRQADARYNDYLHMEENHEND